MPVMATTLAMRAAPTATRLATHVLISINDHGGCATTFGYVGTVLSDGDRSQDKGSPKQYVEQAASAGRTASTVE